MLHFLFLTFIIGLQTVPYTTSFSLNFLKKSKAHSIPLSSKSEKYQIGPIETSFKNSSTKDALKSEQPIITTTQLNINFNRFNKLILSAKTIFEVKKQDPSSKSLAINPKSEGNIKPVMKEFTLDDLEVQGELPRALDGLIVRNGPNPLHPSNPHHWFDGDGMLHGIYIRDGKAKYVNRFIGTRGYLLEKFLEFSIYGGIQAGLPFKNTANTAVIWHNKKLLAAWEVGLPHLIQANDLSTIGLENFKGELTQAFTAHPKIDPSTGELLFFWSGQNLLIPEIHCGKFDQNGNLNGQLITIPLRNQVFMHDFAITKNYFIFLEFPMKFNFWNGNLDYKPELGSRIGILPRNGTASDIRWFEVDPHYVFHTVNAYEKNDEIYLYAIASDSQKILEYSGLYQWNLNIITGKTIEGYLNKENAEFPVINRNRVGLEFQYAYSTFISKEDGAGAGLIKYDLENGAYKTLPFGEGRSSGETVFIPDPSRANSEDGGWLANIVYDQSKDESELVVYDAAQFDTPIARIMLPRIPYGLHGTWIPQSELDLEYPVPKR